MPNFRKPTISKGTWLHKITSAHFHLYLGALGIFLLGQIWVSTPGKESRVLGTSIDLQTATIISLTNLQRQTHGVTTLQPNEKLAAAAEAKGQDMLQFGYWDHFSPSKRAPWGFILEAGYEYHYAGENLAKDYYTSETLVDAWMDSPTHKENLLNKNYKDIGIAIVEGELNGRDTILIVQMFGSPMDPALINLQDKSRLQETVDTALLAPNTSFLSLLLNNPFEFTKWSATALSGFLAGIIVKQIVILYKTKHPPEVEKKFWGHLILILAIGTLILITKQGETLGIMALR